ncbi:Structure-specific endonuclease subunit [Tripterygium wilfordii]|uniref:Structure-specific endonuclease subunit n=1 Tax=Tripterygium wilfordii TaxID=458696 RepID=A0A7J7CWY1_TRIWF|nr:Structure-specific endonuclease subunit [Tripterygium wilfordii]
MTTRPLTSAFRSVKHPITRYSCPPNPSKPSSSSSRSVISSHAHLDPNLKASWCVYLIVSTGVPIKTYVGVTVDFCRRLKQHNGELKGGAKASRAGRPWNCACLIQGFRDRSQGISLILYVHKTLVCLFIIFLGHSLNVTKGTEVFL